MPDIYLVKSEKIIVYDNFNNSIQAIYNANPQKTSYEDAMEIIEEIQNSIDHSGELEETSYSNTTCLLYTSPSPRDRQKSRMPSSA